MSQLLAHETPVGRDALLGQFIDCLHQASTRVAETTRAWSQTLQPTQIDQPTRPKIDRQLANCIANSAQMVQLADRAAIADAAHHPVLDDLHNQFLLAIAQLRETIARAIETRRAWHIPAGMSMHRKLGPLPFPIR